MFGGDDSVLGDFTATKQMRKSTEQENVSCRQKNKTLNTHAVHLLSNSKYIPGELHVVVCIQSLSLVLRQI